MSIQTTLVSKLLPAQNEPTHIDVGEQRRDRRSLRSAFALVLVAGRSMFASPLIDFLNRHLEPLLEHVEQMPIADATSQRLHQFAVRDAVEVAAQVCVHHFRMPRVHQGMDRFDGIQCTAVRSVRVLLRLQIDLENWFENQHCRHLHHAVTDRWDSQRPLLPVRLRYPNAPTGCGRYVFFLSSSASSPSHFSSPYFSMSSNVTPSTPGAPRFSRQRANACSRTSKRYTLSYNA